MTRREQFWWVLGFLVLHLVSFLGYYWSSAGVAGYLLAVILFVILARYRYDLAVLAAVAEIVLGSKGHLLTLTVVGGYEVPLRIALFLVLVPLGSWRLWRSRHEPLVRRWRQWPVLLPLLVLGVVIVVGFVQGLWRGYGFRAVYLDGNAYLFIGFLIALLAATSQGDFIRRATDLIVLASVCLAVETLGLFYVFTHQFGFFTIDLYHWVRDSGLGELTPTATGAYRIFLQSQIYLPIAWWIVLWRTRTRRLTVGVAAVLVVTMAATLVSFSRSFWLGLVLSFMVFALWEAVGRRWKEMAAVLSLGVASVAAGFIVAFAILNVPFPTSNSTGSFDINSRLDIRESAAVSRWNLLGPLWGAVRRDPIVGAGFGTSVTYVSNDPRIRAAYPDGRYTTDAFEWGYLDMWLKLGGLGLSAYAWVIVVMLRGAYRADRWRGQSLGLLLGFLAVVGTNIGSPYLNHPLGIAYLLLLYLTYASSPPPGVASLSAIV